MRSMLLVLFLAAAAANAADRGEQWVEKTLRSMTLDEKIGQMLVPQGPAAAGFRASDSDEMNIVRRNITEFHVGGYHTMGGDVAGVALLVNEMQRTAKVPLLITADLEGGPGYVLFGATRLPLAMSIGATGDESLAYEAGRISGQEGRAAGVGVDFYPVVDVNNNPANPVINIRSFGEDPAPVSRFARAYIRGIQENGEIATAKHFPGHGDVTTDSHLVHPVVDVPRQRLESVEFPPFRAAIAEGVGAVMVAHIAVPQIEPQRTLPATLSKAVITGVLRDELKFDGLVFTDAMTMAGVSTGLTNEETTVRAVEAGVDLVLWPPSVEASFHALQAAVASGRIPESRIDASVRRILRAKARLGLNDPKNRFVDVNRLPERVGTREHRLLAQRIADSAATLVRDDRKVIPLKPSPDLRLVHINLLDTRAGWREGPVGLGVASELLKRFPRTVSVTVDDHSSFDELAMVRGLAQVGDAVVVSGFSRSGPLKGSVELAPQLVALLRDLSTLQKPVVFLSFGSPYVLLQVPELPSYVVTYDITPAAELAGVRAMAGDIPIHGHLPVQLGEKYPVGFGLER